MAYQRKTSRIYQSPTTRKEQTLICLLNYKQYGEERTRWLNTVKWIKNESNKKVSAGKLLHNKKEAGEGWVLRDELYDSESCPFKPNQGTDREAFFRTKISPFYNLKPLGKGTVVESKNRQQDKPLQLEIKSEQGNTTEALAADRIRRNVKTFFVLLTYFEKWGDIAGFGRANFLASDYAQSVYKEINMEKERADFTLFFNETKAEAKSSLKISDDIFDYSKLALTRLINPKGARRELRAAFIQADAVVKGGTPMSPSLGSPYSMFSRVLDDGCSQILSKRGYETRSRSAAARKEGTASHRHLVPGFSGKFHLLRPVIKWPPQEVLYVN